MPSGFRVTETIEHPPEQVWVYLTDCSYAKEWMTGVEEMSQINHGSIEVGTHFRFKASGKERESKVTALEPGRRLALTSTQGRITATYDYFLAPAGNNTEVTLNAMCEATGFWKLIHPMIRRK